VLRRKTHESQRYPEEVRIQAAEHMEMMRERISRGFYHPDYIINMDQTPITFASPSNYTLEISGQRTITVRTTNCDSLRATAAVTVTASGDSLPMMIVFKGTKGGRIEKDLRNYPEGAVYAVQKRSWMDEATMFEWIDKVLKPYVSSKPEGVIPLLFLDSFRCHLMPSVTKKISELGVKLEHIPPGLTSLCQPVDVGVNKPLKNKIDVHWDAYLTELVSSQNQAKAPK
jgi:hypothetical protein